MAKFHRIFQLKPEVWRIGGLLFLKFRKTCPAPSVLHGAADPPHQEVTEGVLNPSGGIATGKEAVKREKRERKEERV